MPDDSRAPTTDSEPSSPASPTASSEASPKASAEAPATGSAEASSKASAEASPKASAEAPATDSAEASPKASTEAVRSKTAAWASRYWPLGLATAVPALLFFFLPPLSQSGLWDPYELNVADLSRRIALNLYGADKLALTGADNTLPHLNDLGRPQLPFSSIALGFKLFGLHEWAGRLPLAVWGFLGVLATYAFVARLFDRRTGLYASVVLSSTPLYFVQARAMIGDICAMAALAFSFGGFAVAVFDRQPAKGAAPGASDLDEKPTSIGQRLPWLTMGVFGLVVGLESRGALLGIAVPLLGVGLAWAAVRVSSGRTWSDRLGDIVGGAALAAGAVIAAMTVHVEADPGKDMNLWLGATAHLPAKYPTFDYYIAAIGHAQAPWSAFMPFAFGRLLLTPMLPQGAEGTRPRESFSRVAIIVGLTVAFVAHAYLVAHTDLIAFTGPVLCAVACAVAIRDFERGAHASVAVGMGTLILAAVMHHDFHELPEKAYEAFGIVSASFPEGFKNTALDLWWVVLGGFALCAFLTWIERGSDRKPFAPDNYARVFRALRDMYDGILAFLFVAVVAAAALASLAVFVELRTHWRLLPQVSAPMRIYWLNGWWVIALAPFAAMFGLLFICDVWLWAFGRSNAISTRSASRGFEPFEELFTRLFGAERADVDEEFWISVLVLVPLIVLGIPAVVLIGALSAGFKWYIAALLALPSGLLFFLAMGLIGDLLRHRAAGLALGGGVVGFVLCFFYYPALANQLSPKEVFEGYRRECPDGPLALLGVGGRTSAYYAGGQPQTLTDPNGAFQWLSADPNGPRRCLALKSEELPKINQLWRQHGHDANAKPNLPIVDARSSQILLAASSLGSGEKNQNPLDALVLTELPHPSRPLDVNMDDKLQVLGIDIVDESGRIVDSVVASQNYVLKTYYRVLAPITTEWEAFIHIDGYRRRHNGDHKPMNGKYPMSLWLPGDLLVDDHEFKLEPNFSAGTYDVYFGLFVGDTRMKVLSGPNDGDNRINGGHLRVQ
jgi:4-amino-4-deoxy-L-arabinose transferase-like glycosyltransferase